MSRGRSRELAPEVTGVRVRRRAGRSGAAADRPIRREGGRDGVRTAPVPPVEPADQARAGEVRAVRHAGAAAAPAPRAGGGAAHDLRLRAVRLLFDNPGAGGGSYRRVPDRYLPIPSFAAHRRAVGRSCRSPCGMAFFLHNSAQEQDHRLLPEPGRGHRERAGPRGLGRTGSAPAGWPPSCSPTSRRCSCGAPTRDRPDGRVPARADRRLLPARRRWCGCTGAASTAGPSAWREIDAFFDELREQAVAGPSGELTVLRFACTGSRPEPYAAGPSLRVRPARSAGRHWPPRALGRAAHPDPDRARAAARYAAARAGEAASTCSASRRAGARRSTRCSSPRSAPRSPGFTGEIDGRPAGAAAPTTSTSRATKYFHGARRRRDPAAAAVHRHRVLRGRRPACRSGWCRGRGGAVPAAGGHLARGDGRALPRLGWIRVTAATLDALSAYRLGAGDPDLGRDLTLLEAGADSRQARRE